MKTLHTTTTNHQFITVYEAEVFLAKLKSNQSVLNRFEMFGLTTVIIKTTCMKEDVWASCQYR